jgi:hypothetical protein
MRWLLGFTGIVGGLALVLWLAMPRAARTAAVKPAPPGTALVRVVSADGGLLGAVTLGISRRHERGFEREATGVDPLESTASPAGYSALIPTGERASRIWAVTSDGRLGFVAAPDPNGLRRVVITIPARTACAYRLLDGESGRPVPNHPVTLRWLRTAREPLGGVLAPDMPAWSMATTDGQGVIRFDVPAGLRRALRIEGGERGSSRPISVTGGGPIDVTLRRRLPGVARIDGTLRLPSGAPADGVRVTLVEAKEDSAPSWGPSRGAAFADARGRFRIDCHYRAGNYSLLAARLASEGRWRLVGETRVTVSPGAPPDWSLTLGPPQRQETLHLRLTLEGEPLRGYPVRVRPLNKLAGDQATTGIGGEAMFYPRRDSHYLITVDPRWDHEPVRRLVLASPAGEGVATVAVPRGATLQIGEAVPDAGQPLGWLTLLHQPDPARPNVRAQLPVIGLNGVIRPYRVGGLAPGRYECWGSNGMQAFRGACEVGATSGAVTLRHVPNGVIEGRIVDLAGRGVPDASIEARCAAGGRGAHPESTGADGWFRIIDVPEGTATLWGQAMNLREGVYRPFPEQEVRVTGGTTNWVVLRLR